MHLKSQMRNDIATSDRPSARTDAVRGKRGTLRRNEDAPEKATTIVGKCRVGAYPKKGTGYGSCNNPQQIAGGRNAHRARRAAGRGTVECRGNRVHPKQYDAGDRPTSGAGRQLGAQRFRHRERLRHRSRNAMAARARGRRRQGQRFCLARQGRELPKPQCFALVGGKRGRGLACRRPGRRGEPRSRDRHLGQAVRRGLRHRDLQRRPELDAGRGDATR